jgi:hypothetical protein
LYSKTSFSYTCNKIGEKYRKKVRLGSKFVRGWAKPDQHDWNIGLLGTRQRRTGLQVPSSDTPNVSSDTVSKLPHKGVDCCVGTASPGIPGFILGFKFLLPRLPMLHLGLLMFYPGFTRNNAVPYLNALS